MGTSKLDPHKKMIESYRAKGVSMSSIAIIVDVSRIHLCYYCRQRGGVTGCEDDDGVLIVRENRVEGHSQKAKKAMQREM